MRESPQIPSRLSATLDAISTLPRDFHVAGTVGPQLLRALADMGPLDRTMETGTGRTTLLLSHLARRHTCFTMDCGGSLNAVRGSPLLRRDVVEFVEGPTQTTLPRYAFDGPLDLALLDGPHGFPFVQMEYWCVYPHLAKGGLLLVDDIHIPSVRMLFDFLRDEPMFRLRSVVEKTAIFVRTDAPATDPLSGGWQEQGYNARRFPCLSELPLITRAKLMVPERFVPPLTAALDWWSRRRRAR